MISNPIHVLEALPLERCDTPIPIGKLISIKVYFHKYAWSKWPELMPEYRISYEFLDCTINEEFPYLDDVIKKGLAKPTMIGDELMISVNRLLFNCLGEHYQIIAHNYRAADVPHVLLLENINRKPSDTLKFLKVFRPMPIFCCEDMI